jgi:peptidoglycan/xylan/chitin deacetylase (PgdA/CDA1 family)
MRRSTAALTLLAITLGGCGGSHARPRSIASAGVAPPAPAQVIPVHAGTVAAGAPPAASGSTESRRVRRLIALGRPIYCAGPRGNAVALTFDDGPGPYTRLLLGKLRKHRAQATFFLVGRNVELNPVASRHERTLGAVGDHTFNHPMLTSLSASAAEREIVGTQAVLARASGGPVFLFRPPYGARNRTIDRIARAHGLLEIMWTVDSADSLGAGYAQIERNVIGGLRPGAIILMHENHGQTIRALPKIFAALARRHLRAVSVPRLLGEDPPSLASVRNGGAGCALGARRALSGG